MIKCKCNINAVLYSGLKLARMFGLFWSNPGSFSYSDRKKEVITDGLHCMFSFVFCVKQYLAKRLGFDTIWFGYLQTTVGVIQLLGGPIYGR